MKKKWYGKAHDICQVILINSSARDTISASQVWMLISLHPNHILIFMSWILEHLCIEHFEHLTEHSDFYIFTKLACGIYLYFSVKLIFVSNFNSHPITISINYLLSIYWGRNKINIVYRSICISYLICSQQTLRVCGIKSNNPTSCHLEISINSKPKLIQKTLIIGICGSSISITNRRVLVINLKKQIYQELISLYINCIEFREVSE